MTCPVCGREYERRFELQAHERAPDIRDDFEACRTARAPGVDSVYVHDPSREGRSVLDGIVDGIREVL